SEWFGKKTPEGSHNRARFTGETGFSKLFSTGALLLFNFANQTVVELTGFPKGVTSQSTLNLDLVQPFLRGGGRAVTLEPLTQTERNLVYDIRAYSRFREQFYVSMALGATLPSNLNAAANIGGTGAGTPISVLASLGIASTDVAGQFRGFLPSLFREFD